MRKDAIFIAVEVDDAVAHDAAVAAKLAEVCPVDIFAQADDECVLCRLCLDASPPGSVRVIKLYDNEAVLA